MNHSFPLYKCHLLILSCVSWFYVAFQWIENPLWTCFLILLHLLIHSIVHFFFFLQHDITVNWVKSYSTWDLSRLFPCCCQVTEIIPHTRTVFPTKYGDLQCSLTNLSCTAYYEGYGVVRATFPSIYVWDITWENNVSFITGYEHPPSDSSEFMYDSSRYLFCSPGSSNKHKPLALCRLFVGSDWNGATTGAMVKYSNCHFDVTISW